MNQQIEELFPFYALDALSDEEKAEVDAYVAANPDARARLDEMLQTADFLPFEAQPITPRPEIKEKLMARVQMDKELTAVSQPAPSTPTFIQRLQEIWHGFRLSPALPILAGLAIMIAAFAFAQLNQVRGEMMLLEEQTAVLQEQITQQQATITDLEIDVAEQADLIARQELTVQILEEQIINQEGTLALLIDPDAQLAQIASHNGDITGHLLYEEGGETAVFLIRDLPELSANETYQAWFIHTDGTFLNAGQLPATDAGHTVQVELDQAVASFAGFGVSVEQKDGSDGLTVPTDVVMVGELAVEEGTSG
ncbi:MAG: anti-sigma factor [Chloroflexota bacterium]